MHINSEIYFKSLSWYAEHPKRFKPTYCQGLINRLKKACEIQKSICDPSEEYRNECIQLIHKIQRVILSHPDDRFQKNAKPMIDILCKNTLFWMDHNEVGIDFSQILPPEIIHIILRHVIDRAKPFLWVKILWVTIYNVNHLWREHAYAFPHEAESVVRKCPNPGSSLIKNVGKKLTYVHDLKYFECLRVEHFPNLVGLAVTVDLNYEQAKTISEFIKNSGTLTMLQYETRLCVKNDIIIKEALKGHRSIETLWIQSYYNNCMNVEDWFYLAATIDQLKALHANKMTFFNMTMESAALLCKEGKLQVLSLRETNMNCGLAKGFHQTFLQCDTLTSLNLSGTSIDHDALELFSTGIKENNTIKDLFLGEMSRVFPEAIYALGSALKNHPSLEFFGMLSDNCGEVFHRAMIDAFREVLLHNRVLKSLCLSIQKIGLKEIHDFARAIDQNRVLTDLELYYHHIPYDGVKVLKKAVTKHYTVRSFYLSGVGIMFDGGWRKGLKANKGECERLVIKYRKWGI